MKKPNARTGGRWMAAAGILYAGVTGGGIGTATYLDATRPAPVVREIVPPREAPIAREDGRLRPDAREDGRLRPDAREDGRLRPDAREDGRKRPDAPEPLLPPCTADAVPKPEDRASEQGTVTAAELNVRQTPAGRIAGQLYRGDKVEILERRTNGGGVEWLRVKQGWIAARFVDVIERPIAREEHQGVDARLNGLSRERPDAVEDLKGVEERPSSRAMAAPACFPPGPWCPTPSPPFLPPLIPR